jgi:hypothetical protein
MRISIEYTMEDQFDVHSIVLMVPLILVPLTSDHESEVNTHIGHYRMVSII